MTLSKKAYTVLARRLLSFFVLLTVACNRYHASVLPRHFLVRLPLVIEKKGIVLSTRWRTNDATFRLYLDNHSPCWINQVLVSNSRALSKSAGDGYGTNTADGKYMEGDVYIADTVCIGTTCFMNMPFYHIPGKATDSADGVIGEGIMAQAVWKIDFENDLLLMASSIDSIPGWQNADLLPASFTDQTIRFPVTFDRGVREEVDLDLGYNGGIILPPHSYSKINGSGKKMSIQLQRVSTPAGSDDISTNTLEDTISMGNLSFAAVIASNASIKEKLVGLSFFRKYRFLIIDYPGKKVYLAATKH